MEWKCHIPPAEHNFEHNTLVTRMTSESIKLYFFEHNPTDPNNRAAVQNLYDYVIKFSVAVVALGYQSCNGSITYPSSCLFLDVDKAQWMCEMEMKRMFLFRAVPRTLALKQFLTLQKRAAS